MSLRLEMLQVARLAPNALGDAAGNVEAFLREQFGDDGGACDRDGASDLYYTVFALDGLLALQAELPSENVIPYLEAFGAGDDLDLVHLACLARCWAGMPGGALTDHCARRIAVNLDRFRALDGGFAAEPGAERGTVYHSFLGYGAHQDLGRECRTLKLADSVGSWRCEDGSFAGSTTVTAAAVTLLRNLSAQPAPGDRQAEWLLARAHPEGGFAAAPLAPMPDLLSTATALHALAGLHADIAPVREACLDFVDTLWTGRAFCGTWADDAEDAEYTFYALLALGHLSV